MSVGFDTRHCWAVRGTKQNGSLWLSRWVPGMSGISTLAYAEHVAKDAARRMNLDGYKVVAIKQHLDINDLWQDS